MIMTRSLLQKQDNLKNREVLYNNRNSTRNSTRRKKKSTADKKVEEL